MTMGVFADTLANGGSTRGLAKISAAVAKVTAMNSAAYPGLLPERAVLAADEPYAAVVLETHLPVKRRGGVGAGPVIQAELTAQRDPETASSALRVVPLVPIFRLGGVAIQ
jgi:hypothetical protein